MRIALLLVVACAAAPPPAPPSNHVPLVEPAPPKSECGAPDFGATPGAFTGGVCDKQTGEWLAGVTVVLSGGHLSDELIVVTDARGRFVLVAPAGSYTLTFYYADITVEGAVQLPHRLVFQALDQRHAGGDVVHVSPF